MCHRHVSSLRSDRRVCASWRTIKWPYFRNAHLSPVAVGRYVLPKDACRSGPHSPVLSIQIRYARLRGGAARRAIRNEKGQLECASDGEKKSLKGQLCSRTTS